jgi:hypothetical protein
MTSALAVQLWLAAGTTTNNQPGGQGQEFGSSDPIALILIIVLFIAVGFLIRSMTKHLKRVPASFDPEPEESPTESDEASESTGTPAAGVEDVVEKEKQDH